MPIKLFVPVFKGGRPLCLVIKPLFDNQWYIIFFKHEKRILLYKGEHKNKDNYFNIFHKRLDDGGKKGRENR